MIFDSYHRPLELERRSKTISFGTAKNVASVDGVTLTLQKVIAPSIDMETPSFSLAFSRPVPLPLAITNAPETELEPDGSYVYLPDISGGLRPYSFEIDGDTTGFEFNSQTGRLSRPPQ